MHSTRCHRSFNSEAHGPVIRCFQHWQSVGMSQHCQVDSMGRAKELLELGGFKHGCLGQEGKDSSPIVINHNDAEIDATSPETEQTVRVVQESNIANK
jgi:hypothetical protein